MKFFAKQKVDAIGIASVTLQKILLFFMILSIFTLFNGGLFSFFLCLVGFMGAYRRHTGMLSAYVIISVLVIVLCFFFALGGMFMMSSNGYESDVYSGSSSSSSADLIGSISSSVSESISSSDAASPERPTIQKLQRLFGRKVVASLMSAAGSQSSTESSESLTDSIESSEASEHHGNHGGHNHHNEGSDSFSYDSYEDEGLTGIIFLSVVVMIIGFFLAYLKVYSLVLAWKLRKMIFAEALTPLPTKEDSQVHEFAPSNTSCAVDVETSTPAAPVAPFQPINMNHMNMNNMNMGAPMFAPGFAPYPYMMVPPPQAGQQLQYPHHMMLGQQPVFYTYAPMEQPNEKL